MNAVDERRGLFWGFVGVVIFAMTLPMTRLAVGAVSDPQLPPLFVTAGRAAFAGVLSALYLLVTSSTRPKRSQLPTFLVCALGTVVGFPLFLALALRDVDAMHAAVVTGVLPLATAIVAAISFKQRPSGGFWFCAVLGCGVVLVFAAYKGRGHLSAADGLLLLSVMSAAVGYVAGARLSAEMRAEEVICWLLVLSLPLTVPAALAHWPTTPVRLGAWGGFTYVTLFSMWLGFFAWYRGLALGGTVRVSQVQLLQPFLALLFAVPVLGEKLDGITVLCSVLVIGIVFVGRRMSAGQVSAVATR